MIWRWTVKNLLLEPGGLFASLGGIAVALLLVMLIEGMFAGEAERIVAYLQRTEADVWVMQSGVSNMHMASSLMRGELEAEVRSVPGVASVTPILYVSAFVDVGGEKWFSYVVGSRPEAERGGPWTVVGGRARPGRGEAVIPDVIAAQSGARLGDGIEVLGRRFRITGIASGTYSMANSVTFVSYADMEELLSAPGAASYLLVTEGNVSAEELADRIRTAVPEVNAMARDAFIESDRRMAMQMGVEIIWLMTWIGSLVATLVVAFTTYASVMQRTRDLGVAKALGMRNRTLYLTVLGQALLLSGLGYLIAIVLAQALRPPIETLVPQVALRFPHWTAVRLALGTLAIALVASLVPARRLARVDPGIVFLA